MPALTLIHSGDPALVIAGFESNPITIFNQPVAVPNFMTNNELIVLLQKNKSLVRTSCDIKYNSQSNRLETFLRVAFSPGTTVAEAKTQLKLFCAQLGISYSTYFDDNRGFEVDDHVSIPGRTVYRVYLKNMIAVMSALATKSGNLNITATSYITALFNLMRRLAGVEFIDQISPNPSIDSKSTCINTISEVTRVFTNLMTCGTSVSPYTNPTVTNDDGVSNLIFKMDADGFLFVSTGNTPIYTAAELGYQYLGIYNTSDGRLIAVFDFPSIVALRSTLATGSPSTVNYTTELSSQTLLAGMESSPPTLTDTDKEFVKFDLSEAIASRAALTIGKSIAVSLSDIDVISANGRPRVEVKIRDTNSTMYYNYSAGASTVTDVTRLVSSSVTAPTDVTAAIATTIYGVNANINKLQTPLTPTVKASASTTFGAFKTVSDTATVVSSTSKTEVPGLLDLTMMFMSTPIGTMFLSTAQITQLACIAAICSTGVPVTFSGTTPQTSPYSFTSSNPYKSPSGTVKRAKFIPVDPDNLENGIIVAEIYIKQTYATNNEWRLLKETRHIKSGQSYDLRFYYLDTRLSTETNPIFELREMLAPVGGNAAGTITNYALGSDESGVYVTFTNINPIVDNGDFRVHALSAQGVSSMPIIITIAAEPSLGP